MNKVMRRLYSFNIHVFCFARLFIRMGFKDCLIFVYSRGYLYEIENVAQRGGVKPLPKLVCSWG